MTYILFQLLDISYRDYVEFDIHFLMLNSIKRDIWKDVHVQHIFPNYQVFFYLIIIGS